MPKITKRISSFAIKSYIAVLSARFRALLQYRAAAFAGFGTQLFWGLIRVMIFEAFYRSSTAPQPMTVDEVVTYIWLGQAFLVLIIIHADPDVRDMVRSGNIVYELVRPANLYFFWYSRAIAQRTAPGVFRALPMFITASLFFNLQMPPNISATCAWLVSMLFAVLISAAITNLLNISLLWTISGEGIGYLLTALTWLLSGVTIPLLFFPDWATGNHQHPPIQIHHGHPLSLLSGPHPTRTNLVSSAVSNRLSDCADHRRTPRPHTRHSPPRRARRIMR